MPASPPFSPSNPPDPLQKAANQVLWDHFFELLGGRQLAACADLLQSHVAHQTDPGKSQLLAYCWAVLHAEENRWDRTQQQAAALLQQSLHPNLAMRVWNVLAIAYEHLGRLVEARECYARALALADARQDRLYWARVAKNRAICTLRAVEAGQSARSEVQRCRADLRTAVSVFQEAGERLLEGRAWNELGASYKVSGDWEQALACYGKDLAICSALGDRHGVAASLNNVGEVLTAQGHLPDAETHLRQAAGLFAQLEDPFEEADALINLARALAAQSRHEEAGTVYLQATQRVETVRRGLAAEGARMDFFATQVHIYGACISHSLAQGDAAGAFTVSERARARGLLELLGPADGLAEHAPLAAEAICRLLAPDAALLAYFALDSAIAGFVLTREQGVRSVRLPIAIQELQAATFDSRGRPRSLTPDLSRRLPVPWLLRQLHHHLVAPLLAHVPLQHRLIFAPHGPLHWLPLHAACDPRTGVFLCDQRQVSYAPSGTILTFLERQPLCDPARSGVLALAGPRLAHAGAEAQAVVRTASGTSLLGAAATSAALLRLARRHRYLHLAGHAHFRASAPMQGGIELADGRLTAQALLEMEPLAFAFAFLNGCESAASQVRPGDELLGLVRALLHTVAPSLLLTLWPVEDVAARVFAQLFHAQLAQSSAPGPGRLAGVLGAATRALRSLSETDVDRLLRQDGLESPAIARTLAALPRPSAVPGSHNEWRPFDHPYYWAPYILIGKG